VSGLCWEDALSQNLQALKEKFSIESPIEKTLRKTAERKIIEISLLGQIQKGNNTVIGIAQAIHEPESFVRIELNRFVTKEVITVDKSKKPHKFFIEPKDP